MTTLSRIICARKVGRNRQFQAEPGKLRFLEAPEGTTYAPEHEVDPKKWVQGLRDRADGLADNRIGPSGDVLIFIHGYNNTIENIAARQRLLERDLAAEGWRGVVVAFDWPSDDSTLGYLEDRWDAAATALQLITKGIRLIVEGQAQGCETNIHLLGHSTGAFVIMEAFQQAEKKREWFKSDWRVGQVALIGADVSAGSLDEDSSWSAPLFKRIMRLTNYSNGFDRVLATSNAKRLGVSPRVGRVGLTPRHHPKAVNVDCSEYFRTINAQDQPDRVGTWEHSWHIGNRVWARDLAMTMEGRIDRRWIPTRETRNGELWLRDGSRPAHEQDWLNRSDPRE